jgi:hypothetical protein
VSKKVISNLNNAVRHFKWVSDQFPVIRDKALTRLTEDALDQYERYTKGWKVDPTPRFWAVRKDTKGRTVITFKTNSLILFWIDRGTRKHKILPVKAKALRFFSPYSAATKPRVLTTGKATVGNVLNFRKGVMHPGTKPRFVTEEILNRLQRQAPYMFADELKRLKAGH